MPKNQISKKDPGLIKILITLKKIVSSFKKDGEKTKINPEILLELTAQNALYTYKNNPAHFNSYPDEDYYPNDAKILLEYFCFCIENQKEVPEELLGYFKDCFKKILNGSQSIERCLNLVGRKVRNKFLAPDYLSELTSNILDKGISLTKACKEAQLSGVTKSDKTIMQDFNSYKNLLLFDWMVGKEISLNRKFYTTDLTTQQHKAIKKYFKITLPT